MSADLTRDFAFGLPKAELHLHLEGTLEPDLKLALARKNGVDIGQSTVEEVRASYRFNDLTSFLVVAASTTTNTDATQATVSTAVLDADLKRSCARTNTPRTRLSNAIQTPSKRKRHKATRS